MTVTADSGAENLTLEKQLLKAVSYWAWRNTHHRDNPFYPTKEDLVGIVWTKILEPETKATIEEIWDHPDPSRGGVSGVSKYVSVVAAHACEDFHRQQSARKSLLCAVSLSDAVTNGDGDKVRVGSLADTITDEIDGFQSFAFSDLEGEMSSEEFAILFKLFVESKKLREIAAETNTSKSEAGRTALRARTKAKKWIEWLRKASLEQARSYVCPVFSSRPPLRPNKISSENLEAYRFTSHVVSFRDPVAEYDDNYILGRAWKRPQAEPTKNSTVQSINLSPEESQFQFCANELCRNGSGVDKYNMLLAEHRRGEAVRFGRAKVTKHTANNKMCNACFDFLQNEIEISPAPECVGSFFSNKSETKNYGETNECAN
jgi:DNA-directed RNA polymerase specialized sigma24 family protein